MTERDIFLAALDIERPTDRAAYVSRACADDPALRERLDAMLDFHDQQDSFLRNPCVETNTWPQDATIAQEEGTVIGRYKLLEKIGEGGFAIVFMAEQTEPVRRRVALKVIKPGMDSKQVIGRFEAERQALALMDHPNIAKVFDGGVTGAGRPYFVMELVNGIPLTDYCDTFKLDTNERLGVFVQICRAVQHAHQKGIIHRDLKPSNVLVTLHDDVPVPKVIDFGIAKATQQRLTERTVFTRFQHFIGTPAYMSPEQATFSGLDIDTRSDIYSLGVLLYELLAGVTPFDKQKLSEAGYDELCRIIRDETPPTPSTRISTLGEQLKLVAQNRRTEPRELQHTIRGDLDWIVMKALEKDRTRRYETASDLAADVHRYLVHEPVLAGPPSVIYRLRKMLRRHRRIVTALVAIAAVLVVASFVSTAGAIVTVATALILGTVISVIGLVAAVRARNDAVQAKNAAVDARNHESAGRKVIQQEIERNRLLLHVSEVSNAQQAWQSGNLEYALQLLRRHIPQPGEEDLRTIPWYFLWDQCRQYKASLSYDAPLHALAYSPARQVLAVAGEGGLAALCDAITRRQIGSLPIEFSTVMSVAFSPDGTHLAVGGGLGFVTRDLPGNLEVWDWENSKRVRVLEPGLSMVSRVAWSTDGKTLAAANYAGVLNVWDLASPDSRPSRSHAAFEQLAWCLDFSPEGQLLAGSWIAPDPLKLWDYQTGTPPASLSMPATVRSVAYSHDGRHLAIGLGDARRPIVLQDRASGELRGLVAGTPVASICGEWCFVEAIVFSADDRRMFTANGKGSIEVYNMPSGERTAIIKGHTGGITGLCLLADGNTLVSCGHDRTLKFWDVEAALPSETYTRGHDWFTPWMAFSRDGGLLATSSMAGEVRVWDVATRRLKKELPPTSADSAVLRSRRMAFSPDGTKLAKADYDGTITVCDLSINDRKQIFASGGRPLALEFSADGRRLSAVAYQASPDAPELHQIIRYTCDTERGGLIGETEVIAEIELVPQTMPGGFPPYRFEPPPTDDLARLSHNGRLMAYLYSNVVYLWDLASGRRLTLAKDGHTEIIFGAAFSATDELLATCSQDNSTRVWDAHTGKLVKSLPGRTWPLALVFAADGKTLFTGDVEGKITMWDLRTDKEILSLDADEDIITALALSPDGHTLASVSAPPSLTGFSGRIRLWQAPPAPLPTNGQQLSAAPNPRFNDFNGNDHKPTALSSELTLLDDFTSGHDDRWQRVDDFNIGKPWGPGEFDASAGVYRLSTTGPVPVADLERFPPGDPAVFDVLNSGGLGAIWRRSIASRQFDNGVLRAKVRAGNVGTIVDLVVRAIDPSMYTFSSVASFQEFHFCRFDKGMLARVEKMPGVVFKPGEDWWSEVRYEGETFSWTVWKVGDDRPAAAQLVIRDATYSSGAIGVSASVFTNNIPAPMPVDATFDDVYFMPIQP